MCGIRLPMCQLNVSECRSNLYFNFIFWISFDNPNYDQEVNSTLVSPENSEDGNHPPVADSMQAAATAAILQQQQMPSFLHATAAQPYSLGVVIAPAANGVNTMTGLTQEQLHDHFLQQQLGQVAASGMDQNSVKRRRIEKDVAIDATYKLDEDQLNADANCGKKSQGKGSKKKHNQIDRRRERNRILARRTRLRKKFFFESLQKEVTDLQRENQELKNLVKTELQSDDSKKILDECDAAEQLPPGVLEACQENGTSMDSKDFNLVRSIQSSQQSFIITDPSLEDNPIVFASDDFLKLTGYSREEVLGRNCRFLQGVDTSKEAVDAIRKGLAAGEDVSVTLVNYTADGTPFWNKLFIGALREGQNNIVNFIGVIVKVATPEPGHPDHGKIFDEKQGKDVEDIVKAIEDSVAAAVASTCVA